MDGESFERYARHFSLPGFGVAQQMLLRDARVLVVGAGGLGSPCLLYLAAAGVGYLGVVDDDVVDLTNLQRQILHGEAALGEGKTSSAARSIAGLNSDVVVEQYAERLDAARALDLVKAFDVVVDGSDNFATRYAVDDACAAAGVPLVFGSIFRFEGQCAVLWNRHGLRYRDLYPSPPPPEMAPSCSEAGVLGAVCGVIGSLMAAEVVKLITGIGEPLLGRVCVVDVLTTRISVLPITPRRGRTAEPEDVVDFCETGVTAADVHAWVVDPTLSNNQMLVDVRSDREVATGSIPGAVHVSLDRLPGEVSELAAASGDKRIVFFCQSGARSQTAVQLARGAGLSAATQLAGGLNAWVKQGLPVNVVSGSR